MAKILTKNGIDNTNIDGARDSYFASGQRDGIVKGAFNEGNLFQVTSNSIGFDTCELRISGHRIIIDETQSFSFTNQPVSNTRYSLIAQITVNDTSDVEFNLFVRESGQELIQNNLFKTEKGNGVYQVEIGKFTLTTSTTITDIVRTIDLITGASENGYDYINIGEVTTTMVPSGLNAEVDIENVRDEETNKMKTNFNFSIPTTAGTTVNVGGDYVSNISFKSNPQTQIDNIEGDLNETKTNIEGISEELEEQQSSINTINSNINTINTNLGNIWSQIYPVGAVYVSVANVSPALLFGGNWTQLDAGYALWTATSGTGGETIEAGLPNITGTTYANIQTPNTGGKPSAHNDETGAFYWDSTSSEKRINYTSSGSAYSEKLLIDANRINSIYGNSNTVQPPAIKVFAWKRIS